VRRERCVSVPHIDFVQKTGLIWRSPQIQSQQLRPFFCETAAAANGKAVHYPTCIYTSPTQQTDFDHEIARVHKIRLRFLQNTVLTFPLFSQLVAIQELAMEIPRRGPRPSVALPEIYVYDPNPSDRFRTSRSSSTYNTTSSPSTSSIPMSIPNARDAVPPPLPPPRYLTDYSGLRDKESTAWQWGNSDQDISHGGRSLPSIEIAPGSSLYGSFANRRGHLEEEEPELPRNGSSISTIKNNDTGENTNPEIRINGHPMTEGYASLSGRSIGPNRSVRYFLTS